MLMLTSIDKVAVTNLQFTKTFTLIAAMNSACCASAKFSKIWHYEMYMKMGLLKVQTSYLHWFILSVPLEPRTDYIQSCFKCLLIKRTYAKSISELLVMRYLQLNMGHTQADDVYHFGDLLWNIVYFNVGRYGLASRAAFTHRRWAIVLCAVGKTFPLMPPHLPLVDGPMPP